jgi:hypothetical protein
VLVRAIGPTLAQFDVADAAEDTILEIVPASPSAPIPGVTLGNWNDDWEHDLFSRSVSGAIRPAVAIGSFMGAFPLPEGSKDSAIVLWLVPGAYTALIRTKSQTPAEVLGEIYVVP